MKSLFSTINSEEFIARINKLTPSSKGEWGKLTVAQMLVHCRVPLEAAHGEIKLKRGIVGILFGTIAKKQLIIQNRPFKKNLPTDKKFIVDKTRDFELEKSALIERIKQFQEKGPNAITKEPHSFFGTLSAQEWDILQCKHLDYHLSQFGV